MPPVKQIEHVVRGKPLLILSGVLFLLIISGGYYYYRFEKNSERKIQYSALKTIADLKSSQITEWLGQRLADAHVFAESPFIRQNVQEWLLTNDNAIKTDLYERFALLKYNYIYNDVFIVSVSGKLLLSLDTTRVFIDPATVNYCRKALRDGKTFISDLYLGSSQDTIYFDILAPILNDSNIPVAVLVLRVNPDHYLFPLLQFWPTPSKSAETLIIRREGDSVLFINELRHVQNTALKLRIPMTNLEVPAVQAALGHVGIWEGNDYRGVKVLSDIRPVPGTSWYMVAKIDQKEINSELYYRTVIIITITLILLLLLGSVISWLYTSRQKRLYKKLVEAATTLQESQEEFRTTLYSIGDAVITTDIHGNVRYMNAVAELLTGWTESEASGESVTSVFNIINEESRIVVESPVQKVLKEGRIAGLANHTLLISKHGKEIPIADSGAPVRNEKGEIIGVVLVFRDQSKERAAQKALTSLTLRQQSILAAVPDIIMEVDSNKIYTWANQAGKDFFGEDVIGKEAAAYFEGEQDTYEKVDPLFKGDENRFYVESWQRRQDGNKRLLAWWCRVLKDDMGNISGALSSARDITESNQAEEKLRESERNYKELIDGMNETVWVIDYDGNLLDVNKTAVDILGYTKGELLTFGIPIIDSSLSKESIVSLVKSMPVDKVQMFETTHRTKDGRSFPVEIFSSLITYRGQKAILSIARDITDRIRVAEELILAKERAVESEKLKTAFLANMSHEIRTPMNGILGFTELLKEPDLSGDEKEKYIQVIETSGERLLNIINNIVSISKIEAGEMEVSLVKTNINDQIDFLLSFFKPEAEQRGLQIITQKLPNLEANVVTDREKVYSILTNLIKNALKFTSSGTIEFGCSRKMENLVFFVRDTGIGISPKHMEIVFDRFHQEVDFLHKNTQGAGLGLSIAKGFVEILGGKIWVESELGKGSTFFFTIPLINDDNLN